MIRHFLKATKMNSAALERILANNLLAEQTLQALKREVCIIYRCITKLRIVTMIVLAAVCNYSR